jgi:AcrR family transcriptional regulator
MDLSMSDQTEPPEPAHKTLRGVNPALQARSQATFNALIKAGRAVMDAKDFEEVTINEIARTAGASVGAFYGRFANKDVFFSAIQELSVAGVADDMRAMLSDKAMKEASDAEFIVVLSRFWVDIYRRHRGLYVATFKHSRTRPGAWTPFKRLGHEIVSLVQKELQARLKALGLPRTERDIRIAFQFVNGLLVNAVLNDPGPLTIRDAEMEQQVAGFLAGYFGIPAGQKKRLTTKRKTS